MDLKPNKHFLNNGCIGEISVISVQHFRNDTKSNHWKLSKNQTENGGSFFSKLLFF